MEWIWENTKNLKIESVFDAFSGTGIVSYLYKQKGKQVLGNDFLKFNYCLYKGLIENNKYILDEKDIKKLLSENKNKKIL